MSTITRNLSNIAGANVTNPNANAFTSTGLEAFANDAAFAAVHTPQAGSLYWNTTEKLVRQYNGTAWQNDKTSFETQNDSTTTGANQDVTPNTVAQVIRFTQGSLASIRSLVPTNQKAVWLVNGQASDIVIKNEDAGATAANRIVTGSGNDFTLKPTQMLALVYDGVGLRWRLAGGGSGGGLVPTLISGAATVAAGINYLTNTSGGAFTLTLPSGANGSTIRFVDATESWGTNNLTIAPASGQTIDLLAANESLICDVLRGWVELSWDGTRWAFSSLASTTVGEASASSPGIVTTGTQTFAGDKTFNGSITPSGGIVGKTDGLAVAAGRVGERVESISGLINLTGNGQYTDLTSITLTAGVWVIHAAGSGALNTGTGMTVFYIAVGTAAGNTAGGAVQGSTQFDNPPPTSAYNVTITIPGIYVNISATTTYYLKALASYSGGTPAARGRITGIRITA
jgi:hypothetical protein